MTGLWEIVLFAAAAAAPAGESASDSASSSPDTQEAGGQPRRALKPVYVRTKEELVQALADVKPGTRILCGPGQYRGGIHVRRVVAEPDAPVIIQGADPTDPPVFAGGSDGLKFSSCSFIKLESLVVRGCANNGVHFDDGGEDRLPSRRIVLEDLVIEEIGPKGNHDGIKLSGVVGFAIRNCRLRGWGGSGIGVVGCHAGIVDGCEFAGREGARQKNAIQIKGGSTNVLVQRCAFLDAAQRAVCIGGSTGEGFFRPRGAPCEAKDVIVAGNRFVGGGVQLAWITSVRSHVHHNTFYRPKKWVLRILQESRAERFEPCGRGIFENNLVVVGSEVSKVVNVGPGTAPETFVFRRNAWSLDGPNDRPELPVAEQGGVYDVPRDLALSDSPETRIASKDERLKDVGPQAYRPWRYPGDFAEVKVPALPEVMSPGPLARGDWKGLLTFAGAAAAVLAIFSVTVVLRRTGRG